MSKKKKIILGIVLGIIVLAIGVKLLFGGKANDKPVAESNIEYYTVEDVE